MRQRPVAWCINTPVLVPSLFALKLHFCELLLLLQTEKVTLLLLLLALVDKEGDRSSSRPRHREPLRISPFALSRMDCEKERHMLIS